MSVFGICGAAVCFCCIATILKGFKGEHIPLVSLAGVIILLGAAIYLFVPVMEYLRALTEGSAYESYFEVLFKALGVAALCRITADFCKDCNENSIASKVELIGKIAIITLSIPIIKSLLETAKGMI